MVVGQALAYAAARRHRAAGRRLRPARPGRDAGDPRLLGGAALSSPYRMIAATYWFAAQALAGALGSRRSCALGGGKPRSFLSRSPSRVFHAMLAVLGFDVMRFLLRVVLPISLAFTGVLLALYFASDDPRFAVARVFESPDQHLTWAGFATYVTVMGGSSLTLVTSVADLCRYTRTRRDMRIGLFASRCWRSRSTTFVGGYAASATGELNPFIAVADLTSIDALLVAAAGRDRRAGHRCEHHQRLHGGSLAREAVPRSAACARRCSSPRGRSGSPRSRLHRGGADLDRAPGQRRRALDRRRPGRLRDRQADAPGSRRHSSTPAASTDT